jgi:hypothetical protein
MRRWLVLLQMVWPLAFAAGCGTSSTVTSGAGSGTTSGSSSSGAALAAPPPPGPPDASNGTIDVTFAIREVFFGERDPDGTLDPVNGWAHYGYNIDDVDPANLAAFCKPQDNASAKNVHEEGMLPGQFGVENAFGRVILPMLSSVESFPGELSAQNSAVIMEGERTVLFTLDDLGAGATYTPVASQLAGGADLMATPKFDGTDVWPVYQGSTVSLPMAYVTGNTWVSKSHGVLSLPLSLPGALLRLNIGSATITMNLDAAHENATGGIISGVLATADLTAQLAIWAEPLPTLCPQLAQPLLTQVQQASDILDDGTQDPTRSCDGISIGIGFTATRVQLGATVPSPTLPPDPCADGG